MNNTSLQCHQWPFSHLSESFNHIKAVTQALASHYDPWLECGTGPVSWVQESWPALQGLGLCKEALMCCDRRACLSAFPWQRAAKSNANSQAARWAFCLIQFPPLLSQHTTTWKEPLFHIPLGLIALFSTWCISFQLFIRHMAATLSGRPLNQDYFHWTLWGQWRVIQCRLAGRTMASLSRGVGYSICVWGLSVSTAASQRDSLDSNLGSGHFFAYAIYMFCFWAFPSGTVEENHLNPLQVWTWRCGQTRAGKVTFSCGEMRTKLAMLGTEWSASWSVYTILSNTFFYYLTHWLPTLTSLGWSGIVVSVIKRFLQSLTFF